MGGYNNIIPNWMIMDMLAELCPECRTRATLSAHNKLVCPKCGLMFERKPVDTLRPT